MGRELSVRSREGQGFYMVPHTMFRRSFFVLFPQATSFVAFFFQAIALSLADRPLRGMLSLIGLVPFVAMCPVNTLSPRVTASLSNSPRPALRHAASKVSSSLTGAYGSERRRPFGSRGTLEA